MLMHIPVISQPADGYNADWKTDSTAEYHQADLSRLDIAAPLLSHAKQTLHFHHRQIPLPEQ